jgi:ferredoxin-nitrate reductase
VATVVKKAMESVASAVEPSSRRHLGDYLAMTRRSEADLAKSFEDVAQHHEQEPDIFQECRLLASWSRERKASLQAPIDRYGEATEHEPDALDKALFRGPRSGGLGLLRDLHDLWLLANEAKLCWEILRQAARFLRDEALMASCAAALASADRQVVWLRTRIDQAAPQALVVPS